MFDLHSKHITIETTNLCNSGCVICPREKLTCKQEIMDFDLSKKIIDDAAQYSVKHLDMHGFGEPLLDPLLFKRLAYVREKLPDTNTVISSTCFLMDPSKYDDILKYVDTLKISFFGITKETYEKNHRGNLVFEKSLSNILGLLKAKGSKKKPYIIGLLVLTDSNKHEVDDWIKFWEPKLDEVMVWMPHNWVNLKDYRGFDHKNQVSCGRPLHGPPFVFVDGKVGVCCFDINQDLVIGDLRTQTLAEIFNGDSFKKIKEVHLTKNFKGTLCYNCAQTKPNPSVLVYATNKKRKIGRMLADTDLKLEEASLDM